MDRLRLIVIIPAFCEEKTIGSIVSALVPSFHVLVVDDCSTDDTARVAKSAGAFVISNTVNLGYENTLNCGFEAAFDAGAEAVITLDADGEHDPEYVEAFWALLQQEGVNMVLGVRSERQRIAEMVMGAYVKWRYGIDDILCGMKGYHMSLWHRNGGFDHYQSVGTELAIRAAQWRTPFKQIAVSGRKRTGNPRYDRTLRANFRILIGLSRLLFFTRKKNS